jgi:hypothetical protein
VRSFSVLAQRFAVVAGEDGQSRRAGGGLRRGDRAEELADRESA